MTYAYVGCRTTKERNARGKGLKVYSIDDATNQWTQIQLLSDLVNPSYQAFDQTRRFLYTVHGDLEQVSAFAIGDDGKLSFLNTVSSQGHNPVFITVDPSNRYCFVVNLQGGNILTFGRKEDGSLTEAIHETKMPGNKEGLTSCPHQCLIDPSGKYLLVPAQGRANGYGQIRVYAIQDDGSLLQTDAVKARPGTEPRNVAFHHNNRFAYLIHEWGNNVTYYQFDQKSGKLSPKQIVSSLPETYTGNGQASTVVVHPTKDYLYASNRLHDSIAVYAIDHETGYLTNIQFYPSLGTTPRFITLDKTGNYLYAANEDSDTITVFTIDQNTGLLTYSGQTIKTESPVCVIFN